MAANADLRAKLAAQLEVIETTAHRARRREELGQHAEHMDLVTTVLAVKAFGVRLEALVREIAKAET